MSRWLDVEVGTDDIDLNSLPSNLALVDLHNDNEYKLLVGDLGRGEEMPKLKIFRGAMQMSDLVLPDLPLGVVGFYTSETMPRSCPVIAIAMSSCIYIYRNMKLFYKYYLPSVEQNTCELEIWRQLMDPINHNEESLRGLTASLQALPQKVLSNQSQNFLDLDFEQRIEYLEQLTELPSRKNVEIVCITTMKINSINKHGVSCLVIGSEEGDIIILDPNTFTPLSMAKLCAVKKTPYQMVATGLYNVDYSVTVATREKSVCLLKREWKEGQLLFHTEEHIIAIEVSAIDNSVYVICCDNTFSCYSKKGKKQWSLNLEHRPIALTLVPIMHLGTTLIAVALASGHLHLYDGKSRRDTMFIKDVVSVMKFGQLGQEENVFVIITTNGNLMLKILKRTADFNADAASADVTPDPLSSEKPWLIPKRSKLFLEQSARERENAIAMHETFQHELNRLRLLAGKTLLEVHVKSDNSIAVGALEPIRLTAEVEGLGPVFRVTLIIENRSSTRAAAGLALLFHTNTYKVYRPYLKVPLLAPNSQLRLPTKVEEIFDENINPEIFLRGVTGQGGQGSLVKILLLKDGQRSPVLAATVQMPATDPMMIPYDMQTVTAFQQ
ncbi:PREDICTED: Bardet-Biedl syndrome 1 protein [Papilio xuthus]|uniref:Bardet-Biedl syndrome 1 protein n=1 Tax=Papilio xuthus TaxID=66420 RepID=A0AAJ6ZYI3_PAPXU|nr:PREDICTED: Bardet-Biedl syndrome 1 protein [Papilio xuthus]